VVIFLLFFSSNFWEITSKKISGDIIDFKVTKYSDIVDKIIPFFEKYHIIGVKLDNFQDFCKVAKLVGDKDHLTVEGLEKIRLLKSNMNTFREID